ncbi:hypothetical protein DL96DRAFT_1586770 [Flagelloscypha sp. PMI_526]|nr:hypothetical protein DL96DRAFT_1586770 [Flagelloscypha sp. PMI_526]
MHFCDLPAEILASIFQNCRPAGVSHVRQCSRLLNAIASDPIIWLFLRNDQAIHWNLFSPPYDDNLHSLLHTHERRVTAHARFQYRVQHGPFVSVQSLHAGATLGQDLPNPEPGARALFPTSSQVAKVTVPPWRAICSSYGATWLASINGTCLNVWNLDALLVSPDPQPVASIATDICSESEECDFYLQWRWTRGHHTLITVTEERRSSIGARVHIFRIDWSKRPKITFLKIFDSHIPCYVDVDSKEGITMFVTNTHNLRFWREGLESFVEATFPSSTEEAFLTKKFLIRWPAGSNTVQFFSSPFESTTSSSVLNMVRSTSWVPDVTSNDDMSGVLRRVCRSYVSGSLAPRNLVPFMTVSSYSEGESMICCKVCDLRDVVPSVQTWAKITLPSSELPPEGTTRYASLEIADDIWTMWWPESVEDINELVQPRIGMCTVDITDDASKSRNQTPYIVLQLGDLQGTSQRVNQDALDFDSYSGRVLVPLGQTLYVFDYT